MSKTITQNITFKNTFPGVLYDLYMNSQKHSVVTGAKSKISPIEGGRYSAHDNYITGKNLKLVKNRQIVQTWRANNWHKQQPDSIFILIIEARGDDVLIFLTHANVPDNEFETLKRGWHDYYWTPWKKYLAAQVK